MKRITTCSLYAACILLSTTGLSTQIVRADDGREYEEDILMKKVNKNYPPWYRGCGTGGNGYESDDCAHHYYYEYIGPREGGFTPEQGKFVDSDRIYCGTFHMKPGKTYPSHNHPSREMYYIMEGTADWYTGDTKQAMQVTPGTFISHPPYTPHGWTVTSDNMLRAFYCWWAEGEDDLATKTLSKGGRLTNPCRDQSPQTVKDYRESIAECTEQPTAPVDPEKAVCGGTCSGGGDKLICPGPTCGVA
ncbi:MAG: cupin domain-containing protein, partial [Candidatus Electrothrix sp. AS4_5]|nr:cupin domain-containing protein [Candidatus Electrothrix gigas]